MCAACPIQWSQRMWTVSILVDALDPSDVAVDLSDDALSIQYTSHDRQFKESFQLFEAIDRAASGFQVTSRELQIVLRKVRKDAAARPTFWSRLTKTEKKLPNVKVNWSSWKEEDELVDEAESSEAGSGLAHLMRMSNGTTINGGGDPEVIAKMQEQLASSA